MSRASAGRRRSAFGRAAPEAVGVFLDLARGELRAPCAEADESGPYRIAAGKRRVERECRSLGGLALLLRPCHRRAARSTFAHARRIASSSRRSAAASSSASSARSSS